MPKSKPPYAPEFRAEAVRLVREHGRTITTVARELGMSQESLRLWLRRTELQDKGQTLSESEQEELRRLRKEIRVLADYPANLRSEHIRLVETPTFEARGGPVRSASGGSLPGRRVLA